MNKIFPFLALSAAVFANVGPQGFVDYPNEYFVETGTFQGAGIRRALNDGFSQVVSIDIDPYYVEQAKIQFADYQNVKIYQGDSAKDLWSIIENINGRITFWLDGHNMYPVANQKNCPLLEELDQIKKHPIKNHTIIIDDMHCLDTIYFDYLNRNTLIKKIREINPLYEISYMVGGDSGSHPNNIMIAKVP